MYKKNSILSASKYFPKKFPGKILFAVKTNPHPEVIKTLIKRGINQVDVGSIEEKIAVKIPKIAPTTTSIRKCWPK